MIYRPHLGSQACCAYAYGGKEAVRPMLKVEALVRGVFSGLSSAIEGELTAHNNPCDETA